SAGGASLLVLAPTLGAGGGAGFKISGVGSPPWLRAAEIAFAMCCALLVALAWRRNRDARLAAASLAAYAVTIALIAALILRISYVHHWIVATPFQYLAVALAVQALARSPQRRVIAFGAAPVLVVVLALRAVNVVALERDLAARQASLGFHASKTAVAQYVVDHRNDATFVAADWGFGVQIYAPSNGTLAGPGPFRGWGGGGERGRGGEEGTARARPGAGRLGGAGGGGGLLGSHERHREDARYGRERQAAAAGSSSGRLAGRRGDHVRGSAAARQRVVRTRARRADRSSRRRGDDETRRARMEFA